MGNLKKFSLPDVEINDVHSCPLYNDLDTQHDAVELCEWWTEAFLCIWLLRSVIRERNRKKKGIDWPL